MDQSATSPLELLAQFLRTTVGKLVVVIGGVLVICIAGAVAGYVDGRHPQVYVANVFSVPLEVHAGDQVVVAPAHGSVTFKLKDKDSRVQVLFEGRAIDEFSAPYKFPVLNVLGAAPIVRQEVVWTPSKTDKDMMDGAPRPSKGTYCGARAIDPMDADDILRAKPDEIVLQQGASTTEVRKRLNFQATASPFDCVRELEKQRKVAEATKIGSPTRLVEARSESLRPPAA